MADHSFTIRGQAKFQSVIQGIEELEKKVGEAAATTRKLAEESKLAGGAKARYAREALKHAKAEEKALEKQLEAEKKAHQWSLDSEARADVIRERRLGRKLQREQEFRDKVLKVAQGRMKAEEDAFAKALANAERANAQSLEFRQRAQREVAAKAEKMEKDRQVWLEAREKKIAASAAKEAAERQRQMESEARADKIKERMLDRQMKLEAEAARKRSEFEQNIARRRAEFEKNNSVGVTLKRTADATIAAGRAFGVYAAAATGAFYTVDKFVNETIKLNSVQANLRFSIEGAQKAALDMVPAFEMSRLAVMATGMSVVKGKADFDKLVTSTTKVALSLGRDVPDSIRRVIEGTGKMETEMLDELGITVKAVDAYKEYADAHGKVVYALDAHEKKAAFTNAVMKQLDDKAKNATVAVGAFGHAWNDLKTDMEDWSRGAGQWVLDKLDRIAAHRKEAQDNFAKGVAAQNPDRRFAEEEAAEVYAENFSGMKQTFGWIPGLQQVMAMEAALDNKAIAEKYESMRRLADLPPIDLSGMIPKEGPIANFIESMKKASELAEQARKADEARIKAVDEINEELEKQKQLALEDQVARELGLKTQRILAQEEAERTAAIGRNSHALSMFETDIERRRLNGMSELEAVNELERERTAELKIRQGLIKTESEFMAVLAELARVALQADTERLRIQKEATERARARALAELDIRKSELEIQAQLSEITGGANAMELVSMRLEAQMKDLEARKEIFQRAGDTLEVERLQLEATRATNDAMKERATLWAEDIAAWRESGLAESQRGIIEGQFRKDRRAQDSMQSLEYSETSRQLGLEFQGKGDQHDPFVMQQAELNAQQAALEEKLRLNQVEQAAAQELLSSQYLEIQEKARLQQELTRLTEEQSNIRMGIDRAEQDQRMMGLKKEYAAREKQKQTTVKTLGTISSVTGQMSSQVIGHITAQADAYGLSEKQLRKMKAIEMGISAVTEGVEAAKDFAAQNYFSAAMHTAAAVMATVAAVQIGQGAGTSGVGGGTAPGGLGGKLGAGTPVQRQSRELPDGPISRSGTTSGQVKAGSPGAKPQGSVNQNVTINNYSLAGPDSEKMLIDVRKGLKKLDQNYGAA